MAYNVPKTVLSSECTSPLKSWNVCIAYLSGENEKLSRGEGEKAGKGGARDI